MVIMGNINVDNVVDMGDVSITFRNCGVSEHFPFFGSLKFKAVFFKKNSFILPYSPIY